MQKIRAVWTTAMGERIEVCDMDTDHVMNTLRYLARKAAMIPLEEKVIEGAFGIEVTQLINADSERKIGICHYWARIMAQELKNRGADLEDVTDRETRRLMDSMEDF